MRGLLEFRRQTAIHLQLTNSSKMKSLNHTDFFPDFFDAKAMVVLYRIKYTEKVAMQLVKQRYDLWKASDKMTFHIGPEDWCENISIDEKRKEPKP